MEIKAFEVVKIGTVFALYGEKGELLIAARDRAKVEAELSRIKKPVQEPPPEAVEAPPQPLEGEGIEVPTPPTEDATEEPLPSLDEIPFQELRAIAKAQEIPGYIKMKTDTLKAAILAKVAGEDEEAEPEAPAEAEATAEGPEF